MNRTLALRVPLSVGFEEGKYFEGWKTLRTQKEHWCFEDPLKENYP
jgi:hypothetical protein